MQRSALELAKAPLINLDRRNRSTSTTQQIGRSTSVFPFPGPDVVVRKKRSMDTPGPVTIITGFWDDNNDSQIQKKQRTVLPITSLRTDDDRRANANGVVPHKRLMRGPNGNGLWAQDFPDTHVSDRVGKEFGFGRRTQGSWMEEHKNTNGRLHKKRLVGGPITGFWKDDNISKEDLDNDLDTYMSGSSGGVSRGNGSSCGLSKGKLDQDLEEYMNERAPSVMDHNAAKHTESGDVDSSGHDDKIEVERADDQGVTCDGEVNDEPISQDNQSAPMNL